VSDRGSNIRQALDKRLKSIEYIPCLGHSLNLCGKDLSKKKKPSKDEAPNKYANYNANVDLIEDLVAKCSTLVSTFRNSRSLSRKLAKEQLKIKKQDPNQSTCKLIKECEIRWNTRFDMVESVVDNHKAIKSVIKSDSNLKEAHYNKLIDEDGLDALATLVELLRPLKELTTLLSATAYPTNSQVVIYLCRLHNA
jgi:hypothetical protein